MVISLTGARGQASGPEGAAPQLQIGDLRGYALDDLVEDATAKEFASLLKEGSEKDAVSLAKAKAASKPGESSGMGHFLLGLAAELGKGMEADPKAAEEHYRQGVKAGHVPSAVNLAVLLMRQNASNPEAAAVLRPVVANDPKVAGFFMGVACLTGSAGTPDFQSAAQMWSKASEAGSSLADRHLGYLYEGAFGFPAQVDLPKAAAAFEKGAKAGDAEAAIRLGRLIIASGDKIGKKVEEASKWFEKAAESNNPGALFLLGQLREGGVEGIAADPKGAREVYTRAAEQGHGMSLFKLGYLTEKGIGGAADLAAAVQLYKKGVEAGSAPAAYNLGVLTRKGEGVEKSAEGAFRLFLESGLRGFAPGALAAGSAYLTGTGTHQDAVAAAAWFGRAAEGGESDAMVNLAEMMLSGQGLPMDAGLVGQLCERAFALENPRAGMLLGKMAERGVVLAKNPAQALAFYWWAAKRKHEEADKEAARLSKEVTPEQTKEAEKFAAQLEKNKLAQPPPADAGKSGSVGKPGGGGK